MQWAEKPITARKFIIPIADFLIQRNWHVELWSAGQVFGSQTEPADAALSSHVRQIGIPAGLSPLKLIRSVSQIRRALRACRPLVVHAHQTRGAFPCLLAAKMEHIPYRIYHNHGMPYFGHSGVTKELLFNFEKANVYCATHVLGVSKSVMRKAIHDGLLRGISSTVLGPGSIAGIDLNAFSSSCFDSDHRLLARKSLQIPPSTFVVGYVGRPVMRKGFQDVIREWQLSKLARDGARLLMAGCSDKDVLAIDGSRPANVQCLGFVDEIKNFFASVDCVVLPSYHEGFPYALLEGGAAGRALLGYDIPGIQCAIQDKKTGLLVPPGTTGQFAAALRRFHVEIALREEFGKNARMRVEVEFERGRILGYLDQYYRSILDLSVIEQPLDPFSNGSIDMHFGRKV